jgi:hypothetical protein
MPAWHPSIRQSVQNGQLMQADPAQRLEKVKDARSTRAILPTGFHRTGGADEHLPSTAGIHGTAAAWPLAARRSQRCR